jgi:hypothetical protein
MIKYFHELTDVEFDKLVDQNKITWAEGAKLYPQPPWCEYPGAVCGEMGCWSLMLHLIHNYESCNGCDMQKARTIRGRFRRWLKLRIRPSIRRFIWFKLGLRPKRFKKQIKETTHEH